MCSVFIAAGKLSLVAENKGFPLVVHGLLIVVASLVSEHGLWCTWASVLVAHRLLSIGSVVVGPGPGCAEECGIFLQQGWNWCPLHWQADS